MFGLGIIQKLVEGEVEQAAKGLTELFVKSGEETINELLGPLRGKELLNGLTNLVSNPSSGQGRDRGRRSMQPWQRVGWARSRQEWLNESWRHDWRSQPRDAQGRWMPGRLDHLVSGKRKGTTFMVSRRGRKIRRIRRAGKRAGRSLARSGIISSFGLD